MKWGWGALKWKRHNDVLRDKSGWEITWPLRYYFRALCKKSRFKTVLFSSYSRLAILLFFPKYLSRQRWRVLVCFFSHKNTEVWKGVLSSLVRCVDSLKRKIQLLQVSYLKIAEKHRGVIEVGYKKFRYCFVLLRHTCYIKTTQ